MVGLSQRLSIGRVLDAAGELGRSAAAGFGPEGRPVGLFRKSVDVGVVGLYQSGKTTFLTSLIAHLTHHDPEAFPIGRGVDIAPPRALPTDPGFESFNAEANRARLSKDGRWPEKTAAITQHRAELDLSGSISRSVRLSLLDCPGERMADLPMAGKDFGEWSDWTLAQLRAGTLASHCAGFLQAADAQEGDADAYVRTYREALAKLALSYTPMVSPSYFMLDEQGGEIAPSERTVEALVHQRHAGLDAERQFAPMSVEHRASMPELAARFAAHYDDYQRIAVAPLARWLRRCQHLVVLVDLSMVLSGGLGMLRAHRALIDQLLEAADPGFGDLGEFTRRVTSLVGRPLPGVRKITFVATKSDKFHPEDRVRLDGLLRQMVRESVRRNASRAKHLDIEYLICAAVRSTRATTDGRLMATLPGRDTPSVFSVSRVPEEWPRDGWGEYRFTSVEPRIPENEMYAPPHIGMHLVARSVLGLGTDGGGGG